MWTTGWHPMLISVSPTQRFQQAEKGQRRVRDPVTGGEIIVKDADPKGGFTISRLAGF